MGMPAGRGKECLMVDKPKRRRIGISDRVRIQAALESGLPPSKIAEDTGFSKSAICREITSRSAVKNPTAPRCRPVLYACNKCVKRAYCNRRKLYYSYRNADADAAAKRRGPRSGRRLTDGQIKSLDALVSHRIKLGQSIHHVFATDPDVRKICSERTLRRAIVDGLLSVKAHELRRYVRFRRRREEKPNGQALMVSDVRKLLGRMYKDYLAYVEGHPGCSVCQLDSVVGKAEDRKAILTFTWPESNFQIGILIDKGSPASARKAIIKTLKAVGRACPNTRFPMEALLPTTGRSSATTGWRRGR